MPILVTGGAGYIGSHTCVELLNKGYDIVVLDNLSNSKIEALNRIRKITSSDFKSYHVNLLDYKDVEMVFEENNIEAVIHFAGLKAVGESVNSPLYYYNNNVTGTINLCNVMKKYSVKSMVFSSSATVYGVPDTVPIKEDFSLSATNPYGKTKFMIEEILRDLHVSDSTWSISLLRYFNPIGAHETGDLGEDPNGIPNNLMPYISQVASGKLEKLKIFGNDYPTSDGTGVRDYIHVVDLAKGHLKALEFCMYNNGVEAFNLGTGNGYSVLEMVEAFQTVNKIEVPYEIVERRPGDVALCYADPTKAEQVLGWEAKKGIQDMCRDTWNWQMKNPHGYSDSFSYS